MNLSETQLEFLKLTKEFCDARNNLERFLHDNQMMTIESNQIFHNNYNPIIDYSEMYPVDFLKAEPNLKILEWIIEEQ